MNTLQRQINSRMRVEFLLFILIIFLVGCGVEYKVPDIAKIYNRSAQASDLHKNAVIVIPGILGSKLVEKESGRVVWGAFEGGYANPDNPEGARLIALPMQKGVPLDQLRDSVYSDGALDRIKVRVFSLPITLNAYGHILSTLGAGGFRDEAVEFPGVDYGDEHFTCFQFDYDWRRDNVENAKRLHEFIMEKRSYLKEEFRKKYGVEDYDIKFDVVAHSMGGLILRYYLPYGTADLPKDGSKPVITWKGGKYIEKAVIVSTPNAGSVDTIRYLIDGRDFGLFLPKYEPVIIGTMPSGYQLLPRTRHGTIRDETGTALDIMDPELWIDMKWGLAAPQQDKVLKHLLPDISDHQERRSIALDHLRKSLKRAKQFQEVLDAPANPPPQELKLYLIAGDAAPTNSVVAVNKSTGEIEMVEKAPGDGTVIRSSALMDERIGKNEEWTPSLKTPIKWEDVMFFPQDHLGITKDPAFTDNILFLLLEHHK